MADNTPSPGGAARGLQLDVHILGINPREVPAGHGWKGGLSIFTAIVLATATLCAVNSLGSLLRIQDKLSEAEPFLRRALEGFCRTMGEEHPNSRIASLNLAQLLKERMTKGR